MAARLRKNHQEEIRTKIQASVLVSRLMGHVEGKNQMSPSQIRAAEVLLNKSLPNLSDVKVDMTGNQVVFNLNTKLGDDEKK